MPLQDRFEELHRSDDVVLEDDGHGGLGGGIDGVVPRVGAPEGGLRDRAAAAAIAHHRRARRAEAGGDERLRSAEDSLTGTLSLVPQVVDIVDVPVIAAGGIGDARGVIAALALGGCGKAGPSGWVARDADSAIHVEGTSADELDINSVAGEASLLHAVSCEIAE